MPIRLLVPAAGTGPGNSLVRSLRSGDSSFVIVGCHDDRFVLPRRSLCSPEVDRGSELSRPPAGASPLRSGAAPHRPHRENRPAHPEHRRGRLPRVPTARDARLSAVPAESASDHAVPGQVPADRAPRRPRRARAPDTSPEIRSDGVTSVSRSGPTGARVVPDPVRQRLAGRRADDEPAAGCQLDRLLARDAGGSRASVHDRGVSSGPGFRVPEPVEGRRARPREDGRAAVLLRRGQPAERRVVHRGAASI